MDIKILNANFEKICKEVHNEWMEEKKKQGFHSPAVCPNIPANWEHHVFEKTCDKCHPDMYDYDELQENIKEYDRVTVRAVLSAIEKL